MPAPFGNWQDVVVVADAFVVVVVFDVDVVAVAVVSVGMTSSLKTGKSVMKHAITIW